MRCVLLLLAVLLMGFAPAPVPRSKRPSDVDRMTGHWVLTGCLLNGMRQEAEEGKRATVKGNRLTIYHKDSTRPYLWWDLQLTRSKRGIGQLDVVKCGHFSLGPSIYSLQGDTFTIGTIGDKLRPSTFEQSTLLLVFRRQKP